MPKVDGPHPREDEGQCKGDEPGHQSDPTQTVERGERGGELEQASHPLGVELVELNQVEQSRRKSHGQSAQARESQSDMESEPSPLEVQQLLRRLDPQRNRNRLQQNDDGDQDDPDTAAFTQTEGGHQAEADNEGDGGE